MYHKYDKMIYQWAQKAASNPSITNSGIPNPDLESIIREDLATNLVQTMDILARNAFIYNSALNHSFASDATGFHDLVEIAVGDLFLYDESIQREKAVQERRAAANFFSMLPSDQCRKLQSLWKKFETRRTPEARFAAALDRFQPLLHNYYTEGAAWRRHGVTSDQVLQVNRRISEGSPVIWEFARKLIHDSIRKGYLPESKGK
jgi:hypothetical protein